MCKKRKRNSTFLVAAQEEKGKEEIHVRKVVLVMNFIGGG
jgi:hypothetical protein